jgi:hypothetical protein
MAKTPSSRKRRGRSGEAVEAQEGGEPPEKEFGQVDKDGTVKIDPKKLEEFKNELGETARWSRVKFLARNAPFKRRSPTPSA